MATLTFALSRSGFWLAGSVVAAPQSGLGGLDISGFSSLRLLGRPELRSLGVAATSLEVCSLFAQPLFLQAARLWQLCSGNMRDGRQLAMQSEICLSRKLQMQFRDGCPDPSILYGTTCVRHC